MESLGNIFDHRDAGISKASFRLELKQGLKGSPSARQEEQKMADRTESLRHSTSMRWAPSQSLEELSPDTRTQYEPRRSTKRMSIEPVETF